MNHLLITAIYSNKLSDDDLRNMQEFLTKNFGPPFKILLPKKIYNAPHSYLEELGEELQTIIYVFLNNKSNNDFISNKHLTMSFEKHHQSNKGRIININPGFFDENGIYLTSHKFKNRRKYLGDDIWYEKQLDYKNNSLKKLNYTFPELSEPNRLNYLNSLFQTLYG